MPPRSRRMRARQEAAQAEEEALEPADEGALEPAEEDEGDSRVQSGASRLWSFECIEPSLKP